MASNHNVVVWTFLNERAQWTAYEPAVCQFLEHAKSVAPQSIVHLGSVSPALAKYTVSFVTMKQKHIYTGSERFIQRELKGPESCFHQGYVWAVEGDAPAQLITYDVDTTKHFDELYAKMTQSASNVPSILNLAVCSPNLPYIIDLAKMTQTRVDTGRVRRLHRQRLQHPYPIDLQPSQGVPSTSHNTAAVVAPAQVQTHAAAGSGVSKFISARRVRKRPAPSSMQATSTQGSATGSAMAHQMQQNNVSGSQGPLTRTGLAQTMVPASGHSVPMPGLHPSSVHPHLGAATAQGLQLPHLPVPLASLQPTGPSGYPPPLANTHYVPQANIGPAQTSTVQSYPEAVTESLPPARKISLARARKSKPKSGSEALAQYMEPVEVDQGSTDDCCICCDQLSQPSSYGEGSPEAYCTVKLVRCSHMFHKLCLIEMYNSIHKDNSLQCPSCKTIYGEKTGNCPPGQMTWEVTPDVSLPGHEGYATIIVSYHISPGTQGPDHPCPGQRYTCRGFPRRGYVPDCNKGRKLLKLLIEAFRRRLMFTIGISHTTGEPNTVTWNEIHHKTEPFGNHSGHGFPDPNYLDNAMLELAAHGVTEDCLR